MSKKATAIASVIVLASSMLLLSGSDTVSAEIVPYWGIERHIDYGGADLGSVSSPRVAVDSKGNAVAVWIQYEPANQHNHVWANRYVADEGWGTAERIEDRAPDAESPDIAVDENGNAIVVWRQWTVARHSVYANRYVVGLGWSGAEHIGTPEWGDAGNPQIAMDRSGNAIVVWEQTQGNIFFNCFFAATGWLGWDAIRYVESEVHDLDIAIDPDGSAIAVWRMVSGATNHIMFSRYEVGRWTIEARVAPGDGEMNVMNPRVVADQNGNFIVAYQRYRSAQGIYDIASNVYVAGVGWSYSSICLENQSRFDQQDVRNPELATDSNGNAIAVWEQFDGVNWHIWANRYAAGVGWGAPSPIEGRAMNSKSPQVAMDSDGNAVAVWVQDEVDFEPITSTFANRYDVVKGWETATRLEHKPYSVGVAHVEMSSSGSAVAIWSQLDPTVQYNVWVSRLTLDSGTEEYPKMDVAVDTPSMCFPGQVVTFTALFSIEGTPVDPTVAYPYLYGLRWEPWTWTTERLDVGLYTYSTTLPTAAAGTYTFFVLGAYKLGSVEYHGSGMKCLPTATHLDEFNAFLESMEDDIALLSSDIGDLHFDLAALDAKLVNVEGAVATIQTTVGVIKADVADIKAQVTAINGRTATIKTDIGDLNVDVHWINASIMATIGHKVQVKTTVGDIWVDADQVDTGYIPWAAGAEKGTDPAMYVGLAILVMSLVALAAIVRNPSPSSRGSRSCPRSLGRYRSGRPRTRKLRVK